MDKEGNEAGQALWNRNQRGLLGELSCYMLWAEGMSGRCRADPKKSGRAALARGLESRPKHGLQHRAGPCSCRAKLPVFGPCRRASGCMDMYTGRGCEEGKKQREREK